MANEKDYSYQNAVKNYYDPDTRRIDVSQQNDIDSPYNYYSDFDHRVEVTRGNQKGNIPATVDINYITGNRNSLYKPIDLYFRESVISVPPPGSGISFKNYLKNVKEKLVGAQYLLSPIILVQNQTDPVLANFLQINAPNGINKRKMFGKDVRVIGTDSGVSSIGFRQRFASDSLVVRNGRYYTLEENNNEIDLHVRNHQSYNSTQDPTQVTYNQFAGNPQGRYMGYWQTEIDFIDLRPKEVILTPDEIIRWYDDQNIAGTNQNNKPLKLIDPEFIPTNHLTDLISRSDTYSEKWSNDSTRIVASLANISVQEDSYTVVSLPKYNAIRRTPVFLQTSNKRENDVYACTHKLIAKNSIVVIEIDDEDVESWLHIPLYSDEDIRELTEKARYLHYSLFHIYGSDNTIIVKIDTNKLNPKFVPAFHDQFSINLFSFDPESKNNRIVMAFTQSDLNKRKLAARNYFDRNIPPEGLTDQVKERYSLIRAYRAPAGLVETLKLQPHLPPGPTLRLDRYFGTKNSYNIYHAYPCYPRATYYPNTDKAHIGIDKDVLLGTVRVGIVMRSNNTSPYQDSDGIIKSKYQWEIPPQFADRYPNPSTGSTYIFHRTWNYHLQEYYNEYVQKAYLSNSPNPFVMYRYHMTYPDPVVDGNKYRPVQLGSCINYAAMLMHVIVNDPPSTIDKVERIIVFEGPPDGQPIDLHFRSVYPIVTPLCVSGNDLNITFVIRCKLNLIVDLYDNETKNEPINYCFITISGVRNKVKIIYDEGCYIRFIHRNNKQHFRYRYLKMGHSNIMSEAQANTNEVRVYQREEDKKIAREYEYIRPEGNRERLFGSYTPATNVDLDRATHYKMRPYRDEDITRTGNVLHVGGGDQYIGFVSRNGG